MSNLLFDVKREEILKIKRIFNSNFRVLSLFSRFLNECPDAIKKELVDELCADGTDEETAYVSVLSYIFDIDEEKEADKSFVRKYLLPSVRKADPGKYASCEYGKLLAGVEREFGAWRIYSDKYAPYEAFPCGENVSLSDLTEYPRIAFFDSEFSFPAVSQNGVEWMSLKPNEIETMRKPAEHAFGNVTVFGLGLGYFAYLACEKDSVESVTVVEKDAEIIKLFKECLLPKFPHREKLTVIKADAFDYMKNTLAKTDTDYVFTDIWHDTSDGLPLYLKAKKLEYKLPNAKFDYWIERPILQAFRRVVLEEYTSPTAHTLEGLPEIHGINALLEIIKDESLRSLAKYVEII